MAGPDLRAVYESRRSGVWFSGTYGKIDRLLGGRVVGSGLRLPGAAQEFAEEPQGALWAMGKTFVARLERPYDGARVIDAPKETRPLRHAVYSASRGRLRVLSSAGIWETDREGRRLERVATPGLPRDLGFPIMMQESARGEVWVCARPGIYHQSRPGGTFERVPVDWSHPEAYHPFACYLDGAGDLWWG